MKTVRGGTSGECAQDVALNQQAQNILAICARRNLIVNSALYSSIIIFARDIIAFLSPEPLVVERPKFTPLDEGADIVKTGRFDGENTRKLGDLHPLHQGDPRPTI